MASGPPFSLLPYSRDAIRSRVQHSGINNSPDVAARRTDLSTPLQLAADQGKFEVAPILLQHGADINSRNIGGKTPLHLVHLAAVQGHFEIAQKDRSKYLSYTCHSLAT
jgi:ankyrin repeat protein